MPTFPINITLAAHSSNQEASEKKLASYFLPQCPFLNTHLLHSTM